MAEAAFYSGAPLMIDHTPSGSAVAEGEVVVLGGKAFIAHRPIADGVQGALAAPGANAVYKVTKASGQAWTQSAAIYWDESENEATTTSTDNILMGWAERAAASADTTGYIVHDD